MRTLTPYGQPRLSDYGYDDLSQYGEGDIDTHPLAERVASITGSDERSNFTPRPKEAHMNTIHVITVALDLEAPAKQFHTIRQPDFYEDGMAIWIGEDGAVSVPMDTLDALDLEVTNGGYFTLKGISVHERLSVDVETFVEDFTHPGTYGDTVLATAWRVVQDSVTA